MYNFLKLKRFNLNMYMRTCSYFLQHFVCIVRIHFYKWYKKIQHQKSHYFTFDYCFSFILFFHFVITFLIFFFQNNTVQYLTLRILKLFLKLTTISTNRDTKNKYDVEKQSFDQQQSVLIQSERFTNHPLLYPNLPIHLLSLPSLAR